MFLPLDTIKEVQSVDGPIPSIILDTAALLASHRVYITQAAPGALLGPKDGQVPSRGPTMRTRAAFGAQGAEDSAAEITPYVVTARTTVGTMMWNTRLVDVGHWIVCQQAGCC